MSGTGEGVLGRAISGGRWAVFGLGVQKAVGFISFFILARLLAPEDYGVITVVLMLVGVLETLSSPGFERALTQRKGEIGIYLDVFWTFNFFRALGTAGVIFLLAPWAAGFLKISFGATSRDKSPFPPPRFPGRFFIPRSSPCFSATRRGMPRRFLSSIFCIPIVRAFPFTFRASGIWRVSVFGPWGRTF